MGEGGQGSVVVGVSVVAPPCFECCGAAVAGQAVRTLQHSDLPSQGRVRLIHSIR